MPGANRNSQYGAERLKGIAFCVYDLQVMRRCHFCGQPLDEKLEVHRSTTCASCGKDLKICYNCRFFQKGAHNDCLESSAEQVRDKDRSNFCDYFRYKDAKDGPSASTQQKRERRAKNEFMNLFGDGQ